MPLQTKIVLSDKELALVTNDDWILTKQAIIEKVYGILQGGIAVIDASVPFKDMPVDPPKISKGENYLGLPYVTLDHPRLFNREDIFAVRTMFWWANFFSITFHAAGKYKHLFAARIIENFETLPHGLYLCIHEEQWHHHFEKDNYVLLETLTLQQAEAHMATKGFIKIALKFDIGQFNDISELLAGGYKKIGKVIS